MDSRTSWVELFLDAALKKVSALGYGLIGRGLGDPLDSLEMKNYVSFKLKSTTRETLNQSER